MGELFSSLWGWICNIDLFRQDWFWGIVAIVISLVVFALGQRAGTAISRANFIYNISNDFGTNQRILKVYQWIEMCRRETYNVDHYRQLQLSGTESVFNPEKGGLEFVDIDSYINHFEAVYVILDNVKMRNIDELFQQRFFTFMMNPHIQQQELFECYSSDVNDFRLYRKWLDSIYSRNRRDPEHLRRYMRTYTCGNFELNRPVQLTGSPVARLRQKKAISAYLLNYVSYICDPDCRYGYYAFSKRNGDRKVMRIITPEPAELPAIAQLQDAVLEALPQKNWFYPSTLQEMEAAVCNHSGRWAVQVVDGDKIAGFAYVIETPDPQHDLFLDLPENMWKDPEKRCIFDAVWVHPDYRGYGIQLVLVDVLCQWAKKQGKQQICATIHPENTYSSHNFEANGFVRITERPLEKYGNVRHYYVRNLDKKEPPKDTYVVFPYV